MSNWANAQTKVRETEFAALKAAADAHHTSINAYLYSILFDLTEGFTKFPRVKHFPRGRVVRNPQAAEIGD